MGISDVLIDEEIKAGALGANVDIFKSKGVMIVDIGGGTTEVQLNLMARALGLPGREV